MINKVDSPQEIAVDQPQPEKTVQFVDLPVERRQAMLQETVNRLTAAIKGEVERNKQIDFVQNEIATQMMFIHMQALTNLLVTKGLVSEASVEEALISAFMTATHNINRPKIVVPKH